MTKGLKIDIDGTWGIMSDERNYILGKWTTRTRKQDGVEVEVKTLKSKTYHTDFEGLFQSYMQKKVRTSDEEISDFKTLVEKEQEIKGIISEISEEIDYAKTK